jgi:APA family basic amino acid/polyamine antiporter
MTSSPKTLDTPTSHRSRGHLLKILGVGFGLSVIIGNTIGAGIFRAPGTIATHLPSVWMFLSVWLIGGLYALLGAISIAELGTMLPRSGGQYVFARHALGEYAGFIVGWTDWLSTCGATAAVALVAAGFLGVLVPSLGQPQIVNAIAGLITIVFALLQWRGTAWGSTAQNITSVLKTLAFVALITAALVLGQGGALTSGETKSLSLSVSLLVPFVLALQSVIYTYDGWTGVIYFSEEVTDPGRDIPRSMFGGVLAVICIYLLVNLAVLSVLPMSAIAGADFAVGKTAQAIFGALGDPIFRVLTIVSMLSTINACHLMNTRVLFAMARDGLLTKRWSVVNAGGTPTIALLVTEIATLLFIFFGQTFEKVITVVAFFFVANYALSFTSLFILRRREPLRERPYRAWGYPWTTGAALIGSIVFLAGAIASDTENSIYALLLLAISYPIFRLIKLIQNN